MVEVNQLNMNLISLIKDDFLKFSFYIIYMHFILSANVLQNIPFLNLLKNKSLINNLIYLFRMSWFCGDGIWTRVVVDKEVSADTL